MNSNVHAVQNGKKSFIVEKGDYTGKYNIRICNFVIEALPKKKLSMLLVDSSILLEQASYDLLPTLRRGMSKFALDSINVIILGAAIFIASIKSPIGTTCAFTGSRHCIFWKQLIIVDEHIDIRVVVSISTSDRPCNDDRLYFWQRSVNVRVLLREPQKRGTRFIGLVHSLFFYYFH